MKTEAIPWIRQHWLFLMITTLVALTYPLIIGIIFLYGILATIQTEMLKALIEVEATILGFYGLIVVYALSSLDNRIDGFERTLHARVFNREKPPDLGNVEQTYIMDLLGEIKERKRKTIHSALCTGVLLIGSLLASILGLGFLGIPNQFWAFWTCSLSVGFFFFGVGLVLIMFSDLADIPKAQKN